MIGAFPFFRLRIFVLLPYISKAEEIFGPLGVHLPSVKTRVPSFHLSSIKSDRIREVFRQVMGKKSAINYGGFTFHTPSWEDRPVS